jgi:hypothetical protein
MTNRLALQLLILSCVAGTPALATAAAADGSAAVMTTVQSMLDAWREADAAKLEAALHKDFREVTLHLQDGKWNSTVVDRATLVGLMGNRQGLVGRPPAEAAGARRRPDRCRVVAV